MDSHTRSIAHSLSLFVFRCFTLPPTEPPSLIPSRVVRPSLMFGGQGRDVHPQLLVSQRQTQELRLDNQLQTSTSLLVISWARILEEAGASAGCEAVDVELV